MDNVDIPDLDRRVKAALLEKYPAAEMHYPLRGRIVYVEPGKMDWTGSEIQLGEQIAADLNNGGVKVQLSIVRITLLRMGNDWFRKFSFSFSLEE